MKNSMLLTLFLIVSSISFLSGYQNFRNSMIPRVSTSLALSNTNVVLTSGKNMQAVINGNVICYDLMKSVDGSAGPPIIYLPGINIIIIIKYYYLLVVPYK